MPQVAKETKESKDNARRLEEGKKRRHEKRPQHGAGFQSQANALMPGRQPGFDAQARALSPAPQGQMPALPQIPARMPPLPQRPGMMPPLPQLPGMMPPLPGLPQNAAQAPARPTTAAPTQRPGNGFQVPAAAAVLSDKDEKKDFFGQSTAKKLKAGTKNDVSKVEYKQGIGGGTEKRGFWKVGQTEGASAASKTGIDKEAGQDQMRPSKKDPTKMVSNFEAVEAQDPRMAARAVATSRLDKALGTNVIADEAFAHHKGQLGNVSAMVGGRALVENKTDKKGELVSQDLAQVEDAKSAEYQRAMANLGVVDYLSGQVDRHGGNIFYDPKTGGVKGIDNDLSFGQWDHQSASGTGYGAALTGLPKQIDAPTANVIRDMSEDDFRASIAPQNGDPQGLHKAEIDKAVERFHKMKLHIANLRKQGLLVQQWDDQTYADACNDVDGSYLGKHEDMVATAGQGRLGSAEGSAETVTKVGRQ
jgi:hypothetical protein